SPLFFSLAHLFTEFIVLSKALILPSGHPSKTFILPFSTSPFGFDNFLPFGSGGPLTFSLLPIDPPSFSLTDPWLPSEFPSRCPPIILIIFCNSFRIVAVSARMDRSMCSSFSSMLSS
ncbi:hypothetical protein V8G54_033353, partial [Vigna mungo]